MDKHTHTYLHKHKTHIRTHTTHTHAHTPFPVYPAVMAEEGWVVTFDSCRALGERRAGQKSVSQPPGGGWERGGGRGGREGEEGERGKGREGEGKKSEGEDRERKRRNPKTGVMARGTEVHLLTRTYAWSNCHC